METTLLTTGTTIKEVAIVTTEPLVTTNTGEATDKTQTLRAAETTLVRRTAPAIISKTMASTDSIISTVTMDHPDANTGIWVRRKT